MYKKHKATLNDMLPEYDFDYQKARPNRFAGQMTKDRIVVVLDPDIANVFVTAESVNTVLRTLITTMSNVAKGRDASNL